MVVDICMLFFRITIHLHYCINFSLKVLVFMNVVCHHDLRIITPEAPKQPCYSSEKNNFLAYTSITKIIERVSEYLLSIVYTCIFDIMQLCNKYGVTLSYWWYFDLSKRVRLNKTYFVCLFDHNKLILIMKHDSDYFTVTSLTFSCGNHVGDLEQSWFLGPSLHRIYSIDRRILVGCRAKSQILV
jgi:hypothetical protein